VLVGALGRNHITHLDAVVITHLDADHCGALAALQGMVGVDRVLFASGLPAAYAQDEVMRTARALLGGQSPGEVVAGDRLQVSAALSLEVVWPSQPVQEGGNPNSVCLLMRYDPQCDGAATPDTTLLLTGDAEAPELRSILAQGAVDAVQVLKVGHHGSADAVTVDQLAQMGTRIALISVGEDNRYGHPTAQTLGVLEAGGVTVFRTDLNGDITVALAPDALHVSCATMSNEISSR
jgi:competence protein ComEC